MMGPDKEFMIEEDFDAPFKAWKLDPSPTNSAAMLSAMRPDIDKAITANVGTLDPIMRSKGRRVALQALGSYDPARGRLRTHLYNHMRTLKRYASQQGMGVKVPERVMLDRRALEGARQELSDDLGREPTDDELSNVTGFSSTRLKHVRRYAPAMSEGFLSQVGEGGGVTPGVQQDSQAWLRFIYEDLSPNDKLIMEYSLGLNGKPRLSNEAIARKLKRSPGLISQRKLVIQKLLNQEDRLSPFK